MGLIQKIKFMESFRDGNISPLLFRQGEVVEFDEAVVRKIRQSGGTVEVLETRVPPAKKAQKDEA